MSKAVVHRQSIDLVRFVAAFGVVVAHAFASPRDWVGHLSLAVFLILTAFLAVQSAQRNGGRYPFLARARKLVLPWLVWSAFFRLLDLVISDSPEKFRLLSEPWSLLYGSAIHLWFLPFVMVAMVMVEPAVRWITTPKRVSLAAMGLILIAVPLYYAHGRMDPPQPVAQWLVAVPSYCLGLLLAIAEPMGARAARQVKLAGGALSGVALLTSGLQPWVGTPLLSLAIFLVLWDLPLKGRWLPMIGQAAFGIYLIHPFFMLVCYKLFGPQVNLFFAACLTFLMSWAAVVVLRMIPVLRRIT